MSEPPKLSDFPAQATDTIRYGDTDRQGHVNNAVFATFLETGRVHVLREAATPRLQPGTEFVLARLEIDFLAEIHWPGAVTIGTRVASIGRSSVQFEQAVFDGERCASRARSVTVLVDATTHKATPIGDALRSYLQRFSAPGTSA